MSTELTILAYAGLLQIVQMIIYVIVGNLQIGPKVAMGTRDAVGELTGTAGRAKRALSNHFEGLILFTLAVVLVTVGQQSTGFTETCAWLYLAARVLYIPAYIFGWVPWRSYIWVISIGASTAMITSTVI